MATPKLMFSMLVASMAIVSSATVFETLDFALTDGTTRSFAVDGLIITYDDFAHAVITNNETTTTIALADVDCMYFSDNVTTVAGDVNGDGEVNIADINAVIDIILSGTTLSNADVNGDGEVNIADINAVIDIILS